MPQFTIDIPQDIYDVLADHIKNFRKPPRVTERGETIIEPLFRSVPEYLAEILKVNIAKVLLDQPTPQIRQLRDEIEQREKQIDTLARPAVTVKTA